jgi:hypothetical protein
LAKLSRGVSGDRRYNLQERLPREDAGRGSRPDFRSIVYGQCRGVPGAEAGVQRGSFLALGWTEAEVTHKLPLLGGEGVPQVLTTGIRVSITFVGPRPVAALGYGKC